MSELDELMAQKREIERKIRELKCKTAEFGSAICAFERYPTDLPDRWYVAIKVNYGEGYRRKTSHRSVINGASKQEVIAKIPDIIRDLQGLYDQEKDA